MRKRDFLAAGLGLSAGLAASSILSPVLGQGAPARGAAPAAGGGRGRGAVATARARTTRMFRSPGLYPNGLAVAPEGLWIGQQKVSPSVSRDWGVPLPANRDEDAWLVDWNGKVLRTVTTPSRNCSGTAWGGGSLWMASNESPHGIFQMDGATGRLIRERQIPLAMDAWGGGCHGLQWHNGKLWIAALRLGGALRVDPVTWVPEVLIRVASEEKPRLHDITFDAAGDMWVVTGTNANTYAAARAGLSKYDGKTGQLVMTVDLEPGSADPHGLVFYNGKLISCDAGNHPGWKESESPHSGWIFSIDIV